VRAEHGAAAIGALAAGGSTAEELYLLGKLLRTLGSENIDFRVRQSDFAADAGRGGAPWLGMPVAELAGLDRLLLVGSFLRQDHPLLATRVRKAVAGGCRVSVLHAVDEALLMRVACRAIGAPATWLGLLAQIGVAVARVKSLPIFTAADADGGAAAGIEPGAVATQIAADLCSGARVGLLAGNAALQHPQATQIQAWLQWIAQAVGGRFGVIGEAANSVGGYLVGATPGPGGRNARAMLEQPMAAYLLWGLEPGLDCADPALARSALARAGAVIAFSAVRSPALEAAHAVLPIAAFAETAGTFVNCEGRVQTFQGAVPPPGEARPGWKVLRVLANHMDLGGFDYVSPEEVLAEALPTPPRRPLSNALDLAPVPPGKSGVAGAQFERIADVPLYFVDPIVRRAQSLQATVAARAPVARANAATLAHFDLVQGANARVRQGAHEVVLPCQLDATVADGTVRVAAAHADTTGLGAMFGPITLERA
jgi:NADH-quinone oxidoreductase subunit G